MALKTKNRKKNQLEQRARKLVVHASPKSHVSEQFRTVRTNINFSVPDKDLKTLLFTSSQPGEGKSTASANLAILFAQDGNRVLLVDGDMRKPTVHYTFHMTNTLGLSNVLTRQENPGEVIREAEITPNLHVMTSGPIPPNPAELLGSQTMDQFIEDMTARYDMVIFDAPPVLSVTDAQILANRVDGTIFVINTGETEKESAEKAKELLGSSKARVLGAIMNNFKLGKDHHYYHYYGEGE
ncbi:Tyrosine-protein kinase YwqD [Bhargavaea cecembensis DSE10]|uniref:non-specific protein-tyrosine kinase n=1 Tax=Bhargavaea cecembensis DSE10 TaxID=1235279 RepID=M7NY07_9BACL|nr:CpsD/CapB family tyrosine-protein kinase [Bhargavaea cecembensis]EMR06565.1 Tyrosine-protein kinase YwqD [Bhargavaea cecembensis DSE10]